MSNDTVTKVFGGTPLAVLGRLNPRRRSWSACISAIGLDPFELYSVERLIRAIWDMGFDAFRWPWRYFLLGAVIVYRSG